MTRDRAFVIGRILLLCLVVACLFMSTRTFRLYLLGGTVYRDDEGRVNAMFGPHTTDENLIAAVPLLRTVKDLESVALANTRITDDGVSALRQLPAIKELWLGHTAIGDRGVSAIADLRMLEWLELKNTGVSDNCVPDLCKLQNLTMLDLSGTKIDDEGLLQLQCLPHLKLLMSFGIPLSIATRDRLMESFPNLNLDHFPQDIVK